ncbi:MAG TPA: AbrB/MazE/SpoVT family DNA-binding domain-containing protein [Tepidisphaeraceae bacterium]|nr:AbrB/MazE/SpoVT family DNA-binding domain-containing protein [Tepidisphaeraceae bacterium]
MKASIQKWGNSLAVRLPKSIAQEAKLTQGSAVDLRLENGRILLVPQPVRYPTLKELVDKITPENLPDERDPFGPPVGRELL